MPQPWTIRPAVPPSSELTAAVGGHPLIAQLLAQRGFDTAAKARAFLDPTQYAPALPTALFGVAEAAQLLCEAISARHNILVWGDFDVDGQTSTSLLVAALQKLVGVDRVRFHVPNRFSEGHGMLPDKLAEILADPTFQPHLILTCDTGIAETAGVAYAKDRGITVVVTDHHDLTPEFQKLRPGLDQLWGIDGDVIGKASVRRADAIVNPKFQPLGDPLRTLPGVGVAYKLVQEVYKQCNRAGEETDLLDLVALGIVADVAEQVNDARYLLQLGLDKLRRTKRIGLLALMEVARLNPQTVDAESIGFQLGPRMNALGRLEDATVAVELLTTRDIIRASQLAAKMERLNQDRRLLTSQITKAAMDMIERDPSLLDFNGLVLAHEGWHAGIVGIVASRLVEAYNKPTVLLLKPPGLPARGSARSIAGVDIGGSIAACGHLLLGHGGHPGAAGLSLIPENIDHFRRELHKQIDLHRDSSAPTGLMIDIEAPLSQLNLALAEELQRLAPFGQGNPTPQFMSRNLTIVEDRRIGREGTHRRLTVQSTDGTKAPVIWFNGADVELPTGPLDLVYTAGINEYKGERSLQLSYIANRSSQVETIEILPSATPQWQLHDWRGQSLRLEDLPTAEQAIWFAEGVTLTWNDAPIAYAPRTHLVAQTKRLAGNQSLVIWGIPPSPELLHWVIESVKPTSIHLCGQTTSDDSLGGVLRHVAGMCKYALERDKLVYIDRMAARLGTTEAVIRHSLLWLESRGRLKIEEFLEGDSMRIAAGDGHDQKENAAILQAEVEEQLAEVRAYRRFFLRAKLSELGLNAAK
ncbi:MAG: DHH family phosphoesterase [Chloroflexi bacterium]|nr:DHH family phosphoesterase [Chloroflexota bacterium]